MRLYFCQRFIFILSNTLLLKGHTATSNEDETNAKGAVFAEVIKNITRVNDVLEDLIKNYEKLKEIYKSQETFEKDFSSDTEVDETYKKSNEIIRSRKKTTKTLGIYATQMFVSEEGSEKGSEEKSKKNKIKDKPKIKYLKKKSKEVEKFIPENESEADYDSTSTEENTQSKLNFYPVDKKPITYTIKRYELGNQQPDGEIKRIRDHSIKVSLLNGSNPVWKIVRSENFSNTDIWNDIVQNKPVNLRKESEKVFYNKHDVLFDGKNVSKFRRAELAGDSKKKINMVIKGNDTAESKDSIEYNKTIAKQQFKTSILRKAYGDACLKVVVKKCYKACKRVANVCKIHGCKGGFKSKFKKNARTGCVAVFRPRSSNHKRSKETTVPDHPNNDLHERTSYRRRPKHDNFDDVFLDITNDGGYLAAVCLPDTRSTNNLGKEFNILRDRFERSCQKTSSKKCIKACKYSIDQTCASKTCNNKMKKVLKNACSKEYRSSYGVTSSTEKASSSGSSSSDSSSSSGSNDSDNGDNEKKIKKDSKKKKKVKKVNKKKNEEEQEKETEEDESEKEEKNEKKKKGKKKKKEKKKKKDKNKEKNKKKQNNKKKSDETTQEQAESAEKDESEDPTI